MPAGAVVAAFFPLAHELDPLPLLEALRDRGAVTALPVVVAPRQPLVFARWAPGDALAVRRFGVSEPARVDRVEPDWIVVPLLAWDLGCNRLGYGGGYYDRTLARHGAATVGFGLEALRVDRVPTDEHDVRLQHVLTEDRVVSAGA